MRNPRTPSVDLPATSGAVIATDEEGDVHYMLAHLTDDTIDKIADRVLLRMMESGR